MISRWKRDEHPATRPLSNLAIALGAVVVLGIGAAAFTVLLWFYGGAGLRTDLDVIRTPGALTVAAGGAATLLLAARRQVHTERDTSEQRITELYTRAVDQLGAEKAPVRLGGLHALERLAQNNPTQRQTIVDVICAYLRMPYTPPDEHAPGQDAPEDAHSRYEQRRQELQVRLTAQRILSAHLKPKAASVYWAEIALDLTEAHLHQLDLSAGRIWNAQFDGATFTGDTVFARATFLDATFQEATFTGDATFTRATFTGPMWFYGATFTGYIAFDEATFTGPAWLDSARVASNSPHVGLPMGWTTRAAQPTEGEEEGWLYIVRDDEDSSEQPADAPDNGEGGSDGETGT